MWTIPATFTRHDHAVAHVATFPTLEAAEAAAEWITAHAGEPLDLDDLAGLDDPTHPVYPYPFRAGDTLDDAAPPERRR